jgi:hypothetical protein
MSCSGRVEEFVPEYETELTAGATDLKGAEIIFGWDTGRNGSTLGYIEDTDFGDLASERVKDVESRYNCKISFVNQDSIGSRAYVSAISGTYQYDAIAQATFGLVNYMRASAFQDLVPLQGLDVFDETKWGSRYMRISTMFDGSIYGIIPAALPMRTFDSEVNIIAVNEDYVAAVQETDPRDYFENGEWNWDTFEHCLLNFAQTNNSNEYVYSFTSGFGGFSRDLGLCNGNTFVTFKDDGSYELGYFTPSAIDAYNRCYDWFYGSFSSYVTDEYLPELFAGGGAVMYYTNTNKLFATTDSLSFQLENIGIVPVPCGPNAKDPFDYKTSYASGAYTVCIPLTSRDAEITSLVLDGLFEAFPGYETKESIIEYLTRYYFNDVRDSEFMVEITTGPHTLYHDHHHGMSTMFDQIPNGGVAATVESYKSAIYDAAEEYVISMYETLNEYNDRFHE